MIYSKKVEEEKKSIFKFLDFINLKKYIDQERIYIKPNFMAFVHQEYLNYTSPLLINSICEYINDLGYTNLNIIESNVYYSNLFKNHNVDNIAKKIGINGKINIINLSKQPTVDFLFKNRKLKVPKILDRNNNDFFLLNLPKFKALGQFGITCAIKNLYGCYPAFNKYDKYHRKWKVEEAIGAFHHFVKPDFTIIDGIEVQDCINQHLKEKLRNYSRHYGYLLASDNPYALDLLVCGLIKLKP